MTSMSQDRDLDYTFARHFATLRSALGMTQSALAQQLGVTERAVQRWEGGTRYPKAEYLKAFLVLCIEHHAFPAGQEVEQARTLWKAAHLKVLFDEHWVRGLLHPPVPHSPMQERVDAGMPQSLVRPVDWGEEVSEVSFYGRESEQAQLTTWIREDRCRLIALLGMGGIGKSALAVTLLHQLSPFFSVAAFRSVRNAIPCEELVVDLIQALAPEPLSKIPAPLTQRITLLLKQLQTRRCFLVLDNVETLLQEGEQAGHYRVGYEEYERLFERIASTQHQSCVLLTSREKPAELKALEGSRTPVRSLHLTGLDEEAGAQILQEKQLRGEAEVKQRLIAAYSGNPLALKIVAETIRELFAGEIAPFLAEGQIIFQGVRALLAQQFARLPFLAQSVLFWLAIFREPVDVTDLLARFVHPVPRLQLLEALEDLRRRSLVEHGQQRSLFTLQSVVMEFVIDELVKLIAIEVQRKEPDYLLTYGLSLASAKEYIRQTQERLIIAPILFHLGATPHHKGVVEQQLLYSLDLLRSCNQDEQGYGPTNVMMLLQHLKGHLQGVDLSRLSLREAPLQGVQMQDASLNSSIVHASTFTGTFGIVTTVAVSSNGVYWAAGSNDGDIRVFLGESSTPSLVLQAHTSVAALAFSLDGRILASGGRDHLVKLWHLEHGTLLATLQVHTQPLQGIAFSPDGIRFATCGLDEAVYIWDLVSFQLLHRVHSHDQGVSSVGWSPDGQLLASAGDDCIRLWDANTGKEVRSLRDDGNGIHAFAFSPDGQCLVSGGVDQLIKIWDVNSGICLESRRGHTARIITIAWSHDGRLIASGSYDTTIHIWQANSAIAQYILLGYIGSIQSLAFNADGTRLFGGSEDRSVRLWELASGYCVRIIQGYMLSCYSVVWHPHKDIIAVAMSDGCIIIWNPAQNKPLHVLRGHTQTVTSVTWSPDGQMLASGSFDRTLRIWDTSTGECLSVLATYSDVLFTVAWSPGGQMLAVGGEYRGTIYIWDIEKKYHYWAGVGHQESVYRVTWSPDGTCLASGGDTFVRLWNADDGMPLNAFEGHQNDVCDVAWSPDSKRLASCSKSEVLIWDIVGGTHLHTLLQPVRAFSTLAWSPKGDKLLAGGRNGTIYCWETESWTSFSIPNMHQHWVRSMHISTDGSTVASADNNGVIIIWDLEQMTPLHTLRPDRPYERLDISGIQGITEAQKATLRALGAIEE